LKWIIININGNSKLGKSYFKINEELELIYSYSISIDGMDIKQLIFKLTRKQLDELEKLSSAMGNVSKSNLIRIAITEYLMK